MAGDLAQATGLGEAARLMLRGLQGCGVDCWPLDLAAKKISLPPPGVPLVLHVNAPMLPAALLRLPRVLLPGRRVIGYWAWELPVMPVEWRAALRFVHEVWVPSRFTATAIETVAPGRVRVVPPPLGVLPPLRSSLDRAAFGLPDTAVVVLMSFNLASSFERKNPLAAIAAFREAFGDRKDRLLLLKVGNPRHFPRDFAGCALRPPPHPTSGSTPACCPRPTTHALIAGVRHRALAAPQRGTSGWCRPRRCCSASR